MIQESKENTKLYLEAQYRRGLISLDEFRQMLYSLQKKEKCSKI